MKNRIALLLATPILIALLVAAVWMSTPADRCQAQNNCPEPTATGRQPYPTEMVTMFNRAGKNQMGTSGPNLGLINKGYPNYVKVTPYVPCILMYAVGYTESGWRQFNAPRGEIGGTLLSFDCGYGVMQITSAMDGSSGFDPARVAAETQYNIGTGATFLVYKWNNSPFIGENDPAVVEEWYFATWAYNGWAWINNPNNPKFEKNRPPFNGTQPRINYPYQELVWGFAANPPSYNGKPLWTAVPLTLPNRSAIGSTPPGHIARPLPYHTDCPPGNPTPTKTPTPTRTPTPTHTLTPTRTLTPTHTFVPTNPNLTPQSFLPLFENDPPPGR